MTDVSEKKSTDEKPILVLREIEREGITRIFDATEVVVKEQENLGKLLTSNEGFKERYGDPPLHDAVRSDPLLIQFLRTEFVLCLPKTFENSKYGVVFVDGIRYEVLPDYELEQKNKELLTIHCEKQKVSDRSSQKSQHENVYSKEENDNYGKKYN